MDNKTVSRIARRLTPSEFDRLPQPEVEQDFRSCYGRFSEQRRECRRCHLHEWCAQPDAKDPAAIGIRHLDAEYSEECQPASPTVSSPRRAICKPMAKFLALLVTLADSDSRDGLLLPVVVLLMTGKPQADIAKRLGVTRQAVGKRLAVARRHWADLDTMLSK